MNVQGRLCITGGAGFLGSHLSDRLLAEGYEVVCLDNLLTGHLANIQHLLGHPRFSFMQADVTKPIELPGPLEFVLHLASPASPKDYGLHPIHTLKVGALGTYHALGVAKAKGAVFFLASSSEVYGDPEVNPQPESYWGHVNPIGLRSVYDEAKRFAEAMTMAYHRAHGLPVRIARIFNTYGPRMRVDDGRALPNFFAQALRGLPLTVYGDGTQTRSFCYASDLVEGIVCLVHSAETSPVNLGNPEEVSILHLAREVIDVTGSRSEIIFRPLPEDDPKVRRPDISRAQRLLGWTPKVTRREGLEQSLAYFRTALRSEGESVIPQDAPRARP